MFGNKPTTTFNLPDFRGRFLRGYLSGTAAAFGSPQTSGAPNITGSFIADAITGNAAIYTSALYGINPSQTYRAGNESGNNRNTQLWLDASRSSSVYSTTTEIRPDNYAINWFIKY